MESYRKLVEVILPSEDNRSTDVAVSFNDSGILVPSKVVYEQDWPQPCDPDDFIITYLYKKISGECTFHSKIFKENDSYYHKGELFLDESIIPDMTIDATPKIKISPDDAQIVSQEWIEHAIENINVYTKDGADDYCFYTIKMHGLAHTILDVGINNPFSELIDRYMRYYHYQWIISMFTGATRVMREEIMNSMSIMKQVTNARDIFPQEIRSIGE